jgi:hypothetical protein
MVEEGNAWTESHRSTGQKWLPIHQQLCGKQNRATVCHYQADPDNQRMPNNCPNTCCRWHGAKWTIVRFMCYANDLLLQLPQQSNCCRSPIPTAWASFTFRENLSLIPSRFVAVAIQSPREFNQEPTASDHRSNPHDNRRDNRQPGVDRTSFMEQVSLDKFKEPAPNQLL